MERSTTTPNQGKKRRRQTSASPASNASADMPFVSATQHYPPHSSSSSSRTTDTEGSNSHVPLSALPSGHGSRHSANPVSHRPVTPDSATRDHRLSSRDNDNAVSALDSFDEGATEATPRGRNPQARSTVFVFPGSPTRAPSQPLAGPSKPFTRPSGVQSRDPGLPSLEACPPPPPSTHADSDPTRSSLLGAWDEFMHAAQNFQRKLRKVRHEPLEAAKLADQVQRDLWGRYKSLKKIVPSGLDEHTRPVRYDHATRRRSWWRERLKGQTSARSSQSTRGRRSTGSASRDPTLPMRPCSSPSSCGASSRSSLSASPTDSPASPYPPSSASASVPASASGSREQSISRTPSFPFPPSRYQHDPEHTRPSPIPLRWCMSDVQCPPPSAPPPLSNPAETFPADTHYEHSVFSPDSSVSGDGTPWLPPPVNSTGTLNPAVWTPTPRRVTIPAFLSSTSMGISQPRADHSPFTAAAGMSIPGPTPPMAPPPQLPPPSTLFPPDMTAPHASDPQGQRNGGSQAGLSRTWTTSRKGKEVDREDGSYGGSSASRAAGPSRPMPPPLPPVPSSPYAQSPGAAAGLSRTHPYEDGAGLEDMAYSNPTPSGNLPCPACGQEYGFPNMLIHHVQSYWQLGGPDNPGFNIRGHSNVRSECQRAADVMGTSWQNYLVHAAEGLTSGGQFLPGGPFGVPFPL